MSQPPEIPLSPTSVGEEPTPNSLGKRPTPNPLPEGESYSPNPSPSGRGRPSEDGGRSLAKRAALFAILAYAAFNLLLPLIRIPPHAVAVAVLGGVLATAAFMLLQLWLSFSMVSLRPSPLVCVLLTVILTVCWFVFLVFLHPHHHLMLGLLKSLLMNLSITLACTFFGAALSRIVREPNILLPAALIAMPIDYIGAMTPVGFTQNVVQSHPEVVRAVSVHVPTFGGIPVVVLIGPGDVLFMAFFFAIVLRLDLNVRGTFWWMYGLLTTAMLLVLSVPNLNIAALIPMGLAVIIANGRAFRLKRDEVFAVIYASALVLALVIGFYFYSHAHFFRHH